MSSLCYLLVYLVAEYINQEIQFILLIFKTHLTYLLVSIW